MTPKRKQWWDSLPANEKTLRENLKAQRILLSVDKEALTNHKDKKTCIAKMIRRQKVFIKALKHELDRTTVATYMGYYQEAFPMYRCKKCGGTFEYFGQPYCCWCGRKIAEKLRSGNND